MRSHTSTAGIGVTSTLRGAGTALTPGWGGTMLLVCSGVNVVQPHSTPNSAMVVRGRRLTLKMHPSTAE